MATAAQLDLDQYCRDVAVRARTASVALATTTREVKDAWLRRSADALRENVERISEANARDLAAAPGFGLSAAQIDRLRLTARAWSTLSAMATRRWPADSSRDTARASCA